MLQGEKAVKEKLGHVDFFTRGDPHDAAVMPKGVAAVYHAGMKHESATRVNPRHSRAFTGFMNATEYRGHCTQ
jgi:hypothetical protein